MPYASVVLDIPTRALDGAFDYAVPAALAGARVGYLAADPAIVAAVRAGDSAAAARVLAAVRA